MQPRRARRRAARGGPPRSNARLKVDNRVERKHRSEFTVSGRELEEVPLAEVDLRILSAANGDHACGQIDTDRGYAVAGKPGRDVPWAAAKIRDRRAFPGLLDEAGEQGPVERLMR